MKATAEGSFQKTPFSNVLLYARERKMTGSLVITIQPDAPEEMASVDVAGLSTVVLENGSVVAVQTPSEADTLPWVLHELGLLDEDTFIKVQESSSKGNHGDEVSTLLRLRAADMPTIERGLVEQVRRRVVGLFGHPKGTYAYYANVDLLAGAGRVRTPQDVFPIVWRGFVRSAPDEPAVAAVVDKLGARALRLREINEFERFEFGDELGLASAQLRTSPSAFEQLVGLAPDAALVRRWIYLLALTKQVEVVPVGPGGATSLAPQPMVSAPPRPPPVPPAAQMSRPPPVPAAAMRASAPSIVPDVPQPPPSPAVSQPPEKPADAPDITAHPKWKEAQSHLTRMEHRNYFEMLELPETATLDEVRAAFPKVAAPWHPDRVPMPELVALYEQIFSLYNTAQSTLVDKAARAAYEETLHGGGGTPAAQKKVAQVLDTVQDVHRAEIAMKRRDYVEAERLLRHVVAASEDDITAQILLVQCLLEVEPARHVDEVIQMMARIIPATDNANDKAFVLFGVALKHKGDVARARNCFRRALELNANNIEASRELRLIEMRIQQRREEKEKEKSIGGIFSKLLKK